MPESIGALINLGELVKPATVLIERISDAIGVIFEPTQIKRIAKAETEAALIRAAGEIEVTDLRQRAIQRVLHEEERRQQNIEQITRLALPAVAGDARPEEVEPDWFAHFFARSRLVSDTEMQTLWARLLAGEANKPGTYSRRTVDVVGTLEKDEARIFTSLCGFCWTIGPVRPVIFDTAAEIYHKADINFSTLTNLDAIGLIRLNTATGFLVKHLPKRYEVQYYGRRVWMEFQADANNKLEIGCVFLTKVGEQLARIAGSTPSAEFFDYACQVWEDKGVRVGKSS